MSAAVCAIDSFNDSQMELLQQFERKTEGIFETFKKESKQEEISMWNVPLWPVVESSKARKVILSKFLRARNWNLDEAGDQLLSTLRWRKQLGVESHSFLTEEFPKAFDDIGRVYGRDKQNNPVVYNIYGPVQPDEVFPKGSTIQFVRWRLQLMERSLRLLDYENNECCTQVHDYQGATMLSFNSSVKKASRELIKIFQDYYPETLCRKFFIHVPSFFGTIYNLLSPMIQEATRQKFIICSADYRTKMFQFIDPYQVPPQYGGFLETPESKPRASEDAMTKIDISSGKKQLIEVRMNEEETLTWEVVVLGNYLLVGGLYSSNPRQRY